jgi:hypothetical protein
MIVGGTSQVILDWLDGRARCSRQELTAILVALWRGIGDVATKGCAVGG